ncbi:MAG: hypothetical protein VYE22_06890 [Myxococcota bacterium]|nr:hypothetical protein [Myxococcota bacterium]
MRSLTLFVALSLIACEEPPDVEDDAGSHAELDAGRIEDAGRLQDASGEVDAALDDAGSVTDAGLPDAGPPDAGVRYGAGAWIRMHLADARAYTGAYERRTRVETPALVHDATGCCAKYAFDVRETEAPDRREVGFVDVSVRDLVSGDAWGGAIQSSGASGLTLYLANVVIDPGWPTWRSYSETNYDGIVLDGAAAIYAEDLTIRNWNADGAIDDKAPVSQFVRLTLEGSGHRGLRLWRPGPHYIVESSLENDGMHGEGSLLWFRNCDGAEVRVYDTTFNGEATIAPSLISCDEGRDPNIVYLESDPRETGEMHEMFSY